MTFDQWFLTVFGSRPCAKDSESVLVDAVCDGIEAQNRLDGCRLWDEQRDAAEIAWSVGWDECQKNTPPCS